MPIGEKKSGGTWWKVLLGVIGGFFLGIGSVAGGVAIAGTVIKTKTLIGEENAQKYLGAQIQDKTILEIVMAATQGQLKFDTLGDLNDISPLVGEYVTGIRDSLNNQVGTELTVEEMYKWPVATLADSLLSAVKNARLIMVLSGENIEYPSPIIKYLSYETENGEYVYDAEGHLKDQRLKDMLDDPNYIQRKVDNMSIKMLFTEEDISRSNLLTAIKDKTVKQLANNGAFDDVTLDSVITVNDSSPKILKSFKEKKVTIGGMGAAIDNLLLEEVIDITDESPLILRTFKTKGTKVSGMNEAIDGLKLGEVMDLKEGDMLYKCRDTEIDNLNEINKILTIDDVMPDREGKKFVGEIPGDTTIDKIGDAINDIKLVKAFNDDIFDSVTGVIKPTWKYMLAETEAEMTAMKGLKKTDNDGDPFKGFKCYNYTIAGGEGDDRGINGLIDNMSASMKRATIGDLTEDEIVSVDAEFLDKDIDLGAMSPVQYKRKDYYAGLGKTKFGHLTIEELSDLITQGLE